MVVLPPKSLGFLSRRLLILTILLIGVRGTEAQDFLVTPNLAVQQALTNNSSLAVEVYEPALRRADVIRERGQFDPTFTAGVGTQPQGTNYSLGLEHKLGFGATYGIAHSRGSDILGRGSRTNLNLRIPLLQGAGAQVNRAGVNTAKGKLMIAELQVQISALDLAAETESSYWSLVLAHRVAAVRTRAVDQANTFLGMLQTEIDAGAAAPYELYEAQQNLASREAGVKAADGDIVVAQQRLLRLMGMSNKNLRVSDELPSRILQPLEEYQNLAVRNRPLLQLLQKEREIQRLQEKLAHNRVLPRLDVVASHTIASSGQSSYGWQAGLQLTVPIGNHEGRGGALRAKISGDQIEARLEDLRQRVLLETAQAHATVEASTLQTEAALRASGMAKERVKAESERFSAGFAPAHRVIIAQQQQLTVDEELMAARIREQLAAVALRRAVGTILDGHHRRLGQKDRA